MPPARLPPFRSAQPNLLARWLPLRMLVSMPAQIIAFAGSVRRDSVNRKLGRAAVELGQQAGLPIEWLELADYPLPLYHGDLEEAQGLPDNALRLKELLTPAAALLIVSPEYNSSLTPLLKNTLDWLSRSASEDEPPLSVYQNKLAALLSASPGALGGLRGLFHLREILQNIGVTVLPKQFAMASAYSKFDAAGQLTDPQARQQVANVVNSLASMTRRLSQS